MARVRKLTEQLVFVTDPVLSDIVRAAADVFGQPVSAVVRDAVAAGVDAAIAGYAHVRGWDKKTTDQMFDAGVQRAKLAREERGERGSGR